VERAGSVVDGRDEYADAMLAVRQLLARLQDALRLDRHDPPPLDDDAAAAAGRDSPPPQSWYEEDTRGLRRPDRKQSNP